jgi:acyl carrier protein
MSTPVPASDDTLHRFSRIVAASVRVPPERVQPEARLDDLGADSLDLVEIALETENEFSVLMPERSILETAREELGAGVVERDGLITDEGKALLAARLPWLAAGDLEGDVPVSRALGWFLRVETWVALIDRLRAETPSACAGCQGPLTQGSPGQLRCPACGRTHDLVAGDEVNRQWVREFAARLPGREPPSA